MQSEQLAGYFLLRTLASGSRAHVYLGSATAKHGDHDIARQHAGSPVALKHFHYPDDSSAATEMEALSLAANDHVVRLIDISTPVDQRRCLVLELLPNGSLARLLERRGRIDAGEAVTIVAPLALAVDSFHEAGVVHGQIRATAVLFGPGGVPTLASFGRAQLIPPRLSPAALTATPGVQTDRRALGALAQTVLEHVDSRAADSIRAWLAGLQNRPLADDFGYQLAERLFDCTQSRPVELFGAPRRAPTSHGFPLVVPSLADPQTPVAAPRFRPHWLHSLNLPDWIETVIAPVIASATAAATAAATVAVAGGKKLSAAGHGLSLKEHLRSVRPRLWFLAVAVVIAIIAVSTVLEGESDSQPVEASQEPGEKQSTVPDAAELVTAGDHNSAVINGNDPVAALEILLSARARCLAELSVLCLDAISQQGSTAMQSDVVRIRAMSDGTPTEVDRIAILGLQTTELALVERLGGSALVGAVNPKAHDSETASVLLMKGEAGWLLRSFIVPD